MVKISIFFALLSFFGFFAKISHHHSEVGNESMSLEDVGLPDIILCMMCQAYFFSNLDVVHVVQ